MTDNTVQTDATTEAAEPTLGEVITTSVTVYTLDELDALDALDGVPPRRREKAIENMAGKLAEWWDSADIENVNETITYAFAGALKTPGWDTYGEGDFPGIDGVQLHGWDIDRGAYVLFSGRLNHDNAPALPWVDGVHSVTLTERREHTSVDVVTDLDADDDDAPAASEADIDAIAEAVREAMHGAWKAGRDQAEYLTSAEYAAETIEGNGYRFLEDGTFHG